MLKTTNKATFLSFVVLLLVTVTVSVYSQITDIQRQPFLSGLNFPVFITNAGDGTNRMFVVEQRGVIRVVEPGSNTPATFMDLSSVVSQTGSERGLLGLAFHPDFAGNNYFFVNFTRQSDGATVIARYKAINNNTAGDPDSRFEIITIPQDFSNHNGGHIAFGPDDDLYIGMGDGGSGDDPNNRAQDIESLLGKMLRITPSVSEPVMGASSYTIPNDNPYVGVTGLDEIWAIGLRNPYRWSFDGGGARQLWAGDVGQGAFEEVSIIENGGNYGWRVYEANSCTNNDPGLCIPENYDPPLLEYAHSAGRCSITGGYVYRGNRGTLGQGDYIYGDFCTGEYWLWDGNSSQLIENTPRNISAFGEDESGELYLVSLGGTVEKIINTGSNRASSDFDGDGRTDVTIFRPEGGFWFSLLSGSGNYLIAQFGAEGDIPVPKDYDGDFITDLAVFRPSNSQWFIFESSTNSIDNRAFGEPGDIPVPGDFLNDDLPDLAVFRPSEGVWYIVNTPGGSSSGGFTGRQFGIGGDIPVVGDYDGNGKDDLAVFRPAESVWYSSNFDASGFSVTPWGANGDVPAPGDYDGDGKNDVTVFRPGDGNWYTFLSESGTSRAINWGLSEDIPNPGDYDGDGSEDLAIWRPSTGEWFVLRSSDFSYFAGPLGVSTDIPVPRYDTP